MAKKNNKGSGMVYSTDPNFAFESFDDEQQETLPPQQQTLYVSHDRKQRKGKVVTLIEGFVGTPEDLNELAKSLKNRCGVGGSAKDGEIILQGEHRDKVIPTLEAAGYKVKRKGG
jgi:translation initiation factor 1